MKYRLDYSYNWYQTTEEILLIKTYYINGIAFTFDELPSIAQDDPEIISQADENMMYTPEDFFQKSFYLIDEECHPCLFELDIENPELLDEIDEIHS